METVSTPSVPEPSLPQRIWGSLVAPRAVFVSLKARPRLLGALLFLMIFGAVASLPVVDIIVDSQVERMADDPNITAEQMARTESFMRFSIPFFSALGPVFFTFIPAAVFLFLSNVLLGGATNYKRMASAFAHIGMVTIPQTLVKIPLIKIAGDPDVRTSLAALLPKDVDQGFLFQLLNQFDIFALWMLGLSVVALSVMADVSTKRAATATIGAWVVFLAVFVPLLTVLGGLGGGR